MRKQQFGRCFFVILVTLLFQGGNYSQSETPQKDKKAKLSIVVTANGNTNPVNGADVTVSSDDGEFNENTKTDVQGFASIANVPCGNINIWVTAPGWQWIRRATSWYPGAEPQG